MEYVAKYDGIDKYWRDDYFFCEDKILANVAEMFGCRYNLMFAGAFNFGYNKGRNPGVGKNIVVRYFEQDKLLEKYYGIQLKKYDKAYGAENFLERCKEELRKGKPASVGLTKEGIWEEKPGEGVLEHLAFFLIQISDDVITVIDPHELGIRRKISKETFVNSYLWGVTFEYDQTKTVQEIDIKEFVAYVLDNYHNAVLSEAGCVDEGIVFPALGSGIDFFAHRRVESPYEELLQLAEEVKSMDLQKEVEGLESVLFVPFYYGLLYTYRSRLVFTKALREVQEIMDTEIFESVIQRLIVVSSKWNYLRMVFTSAYHNEQMTQQVKDNVSSVIKEIAEHEKKVLEEFQYIYDTWNEQKKEAGLEPYFNTYLFEYENAKKESNAVYEWYYYKQKTEEKMLPKGNFTLPKPNEKGDSIVCLGQVIQFEDEIAETGYKEFCIYGTVLYNEMVYDYMDILYTDGSKETVLIGFDGLIKNEYSLCSPGRTVWKGNVVKRNGEEDPDTRKKAVIYEKRYLVHEGKKVQGFKLPNNPFINIVKVLFAK
ncbi:hypothetical protein [[Clostridium] polysaccharolyticum]|uniref:Butirosin biosynthesis protein H, N-terminal n=1 Tax=[Clostridium] polysaccharolyticum TaxID=29364 RepID=A0A1I0BMW4_9FIRM|nr:hypothetical protein [[Clostridium] polysaccharolyticum]SET07960.1 hypothetical protein SAMN04487772_10810 [[Clostridium] polysaccharolyticum]